MSASLVGSEMCIRDSSASRKPTAADRAASNAHTRIVDRWLLPSDGPKNSPLRKLAEGVPQTAAAAARDTV
eukprot:13670866-Alexandrium_andersonii.AAC.1